MTDTFEMAKRCGGLFGVTRYEPTPCKLVGNLAVHKENDGVWSISHAAIGFRIPMVWGNTRKQAVEIAERLEAMLDTDAIRRGKRIEKPIGLNKKTAKAWATAIQVIAADFPHLTE